MRVATKPTLGDWIAASRLKFLPQGVMPVLIGAALASTQAYFHWGYFVLAFIAAACVQVGLTMLNDALDYSYGTDKLKLSEKNPYSGGSGVFSEERIRPFDSIKVVIGLYTLAFIIAIFFTIVVGWGVMLLGVLGAAISIIYSVRPFRLAYRGWGELAMLIGYGPIITLFAYYVQTGSFGWGAFWVGIIPGFLMFTMILINEIPDAKEDAAAQKKNLCYRLGIINTKNLYILCLGLVFILVALLVVVGILPNFAWLVFLGLPLAVVAAYYAHKYYKDPVRLSLSNQYMVWLYSATTATVALAILLGG